jgi:hypothetical protein
MKNLLSFILVSIFIITLTSCGQAASGDSTVSLGTGFLVAFQQPGYILWLLVATAVSGVGFYKVIKSLQDGPGSVGHAFAIFILICIFLFALLYTPVGVATNTTIEQYSRGVIIFG